MRYLRWVGPPVLYASIAGCAQMAATRTTPASYPPLPPPSVDESEQSDAAARRRIQAQEAWQALLAEPRDEARIIWYGRRLAYLGDYQRSIDVYSVGLTVHPSSPRLLRHRGHRHISLRRFAEAVADLEHAARLLGSVPDEIEPDGIPNDRGVPTSTLHGNVWYHLGLARYCRGEFDAALACYEACLRTVRNVDMEVAARYWLFLTASRLGDRTRAAAALEPVRADWDVIENHPYHRLLLLYRGDLALGDVMPDGTDAVQDRTVGYGLARYHFLHGDAGTGDAALRSLVAEPSPAFGCIAAEADLGLSRS